jgi:hypothetical protein
MKLGQKKLKRNRRVSGELNGALKDSIDRLEVIRKTGFETDLDAIWKNVFNI